MSFGERYQNGRKRVNDCIHHAVPDRMPVDFLAVPEIWNQLSDRVDQGKMQFDSQKELKRHINQIKKEMLKDGGYILAPSHHIRAIAPLENILGMYQQDLLLI